MFINLKPSTVGLGSVPFRTLIELAPGCGFCGIDFPVRDVTSVAQARELRSRVEGVGLQWGLFSLPCDFLRVGSGRYEQGLADLEAALPFVVAAGCHRAYNHVWPGSNERAFDENYAWHVDRLQRLCALLGPAGVQLGIEFIGPRTLQATYRYPFIRSLAEATALIDSVGRKLGLVVDTFHWYTSGGTLHDLREAVADHAVVNVHANDAAAGRAREEQVDGERRMPLDTGLVDAAGVLRVLKEAGYDGPVIAEPFNPWKASYASMPVENALADVGRRMRALFAAAGIVC